MCCGGGGRLLGHAVYFFDYLACWCPGVLWRQDVAAGPKDMRMWMVVVSQMLVLV
jgi:hypothetical protein